MLDALGFLFVASEVTDNGMDLVILFDMLKSTFPTHWLFLLDSRLIRIQTCFAEGHYLFLKIVMGSEFTINPKSSINLLGSMQDFSSFYFS